MKEAAKLLFDTEFNGKTLFFNQLDLVNTFLNDHDSPYYVTDNDRETYSKSLTRLKTYISQLLSTTVARNVTPEFINGLNIILIKKLNDKSKAKEVAERIIEDLRRKIVLAPNLKSENRQSSTEQFVIDLNSSNYVVVITATPLEINLPNGEPNPPLRRYLFDDLISRLYNPNQELKYYRFNFPISSFGFLFWRGLKKILIRHINNNLNQKLFDSLFLKFNIKIEDLDQLTANTENLVDQILDMMNTSKHLLVFITEAPIYSIPIVAIEPNDTRKSKIYTWISAGDGNMIVHKLPEIETVTWRMFVWDQLKSPQFAGKEIKFTYDF